TWVRLSSPAPAGGMTFKLRTIGGTATAGTDFVAIEDRQFTVGARNNSYKIDFQVLGDDLPEADETFQLAVETTADYWIPGPATVEIRDDDRPPPPSDFDGDGASDLQWRNLQHGQNLIWLGANGRDTRAIVGVRVLDWVVQGVGDFDGDGQADVFWRN